MLGEIGDFILIVFVSFVKERGDILISRFSWIAVFCYNVYIKERGVPR